MEHVAELVVREEGLKYALQYHVEESLVESLLLDHREDARHALTRRLTADQRPQLICWCEIHVNEGNDRM